MLSYYVCNRVLILSRSGNFILAEKSVLSRLYVQKVEKVDLLGWLWVGVVVF